MNALKIAHIADLHLSANHERVNLRRTKQIVEHLSRLDIDHLVIAGDITADARAEDFTIARRILGAYSCLRGERISLVIGNQDIYGGVHTAQDILTFPKRCRKTDYGMLFMNGGGSVIGPDAAAFSFNMIDVSESGVATGI